MARLSRLIGRHVRRQSPKTCDNVESLPLELVILLLVQHDETLAAIIVRGIRVANGLACTENIICAVRTLAASDL